MTDRQKLSVAFSAALIAVGVSSLGVITSWLSWTTLVWGFTFCAGTFALVRILGMLREVSP